MFIQQKGKNILSLSSPLCAEKPNNRTRVPDRGCRRHRSTCSVPSSLPPVSPKTLTFDPHVVGFRPSKCVGVVYWWPVSVSRSMSDLVRVYFHRNSSLTVPASLFRSETGYMAGRTDLLGTVPGTSTANVRLRWSSPEYQRWVGPPGPNFVVRMREEFSGPSKVDVCYRVWWLLTLKPPSSSRWRTVNGDSLPFPVSGLEDFYIDL